MRTNARRSAAVRTILGRSFRSDLSGHDTAAEDFDVMRLSPCPLALCAPTLTDTKIDTDTDTKLLVRFEDLVATLAGVVAE